MSCSRKPEGKLFTSEHRILVTGASSGIGRAIALRCNAAGATVIASGRDAERLRAAQEEAEYPEFFLIESRDLTADMEGLPDWVAGLRERYGKLGGLACSAGIADPMPLLAFDLAAAQHMFALNYFAPILLAKGFADRRNNTGVGAAALFLSAYAGVFPGRGHVPYCGSKAALAASVRGISRELAPMRLRFNCISPAAVQTPMTAADNEALGMDLYLRDAEQRYPLGLGEADDVASMAAYLLSDKARWITGQNYVMDGGLS